MPRYFFNVYHDKPTFDREGVELDDKHAAWERATLTAGEMIKQLDGSLKPGHDWHLEVTDEFANTLWELHVKARRK